MGKYTVKLSVFVENQNLTPVFLSNDYEEVLVTTPEVNRSGLILYGFMEFNNPDRIQICGKVEMAYISSLSADNQNFAIRNLFEIKPPCVVITRGIAVPAYMVECAKNNNVSIFSTMDSSSTFMANAIAYLNLELAPRITRHGVLVEVYGEGILILGESGIGKSETAIELVKRGHRLIADDAVELRRISNNTIIGSSPPNIRHYVELRGIGVINVRSIFGMGAVNISENIDLVINLEQWETGKNYSSIGYEEITHEILGVKIPSATLPVKPGRNLAVIIEVAAMDIREKKLGYNSSKELLESLGMHENPDDD